MIVDDEPIIVAVVKEYLQESGYRNFLTTTEPSNAVSIIRHEQPDMVILDVMMPEVSGLEILELIRADECLQHLVVLILTSASDSQTKLKALNLGANDLLAKPVEFSELDARVRNLLLVKAHQDQLASYSARLEQEVRLRTAELATSRSEAIHCLARAAEFRDEQTGRHVTRVGRYTAIIAQQLGFCPDDVAMLEQAAQLHDVGKIGVPDAVLRKPGKLEPGEFDIMRRHCGYGSTILDVVSDGERSLVRDHARMGATILDACRSPVMRLAASIASSHHEKWDGTGYPRGLAGADIPIEGRVTAVADVFDALSTKRPYKEAIPIEQCFSIIQSERGRHFDPRVVDVFIACRREVTQVYADYADVHSPGSDG